MDSTIDCGPPIRVVPVSTATMLLDPKLTDEPCITRPTLVSSSSVSTRPRGWQLTVHGDLPVLRVVGHGHVGDTTRVERRVCDRSAFAIPDLFLLDISTLDTSRHTEVPKLNAPSVLLDIRCPSHISISLEVKGEKRVGPSRRPGEGDPPRCRARKGECGESEAHDSAHFLCNQALAHVVALRKCLARN